ncbi:MAG: putative sulfate exporter family transporter [Pseudomonadota bacterium]
MRARLTAVVEGAPRAWPGLLVAGMIALAAQFISDHYGAPAMLMALLFGISLHFLTEQPTCRPGIDFAARHILRIGVALLGTRISFGMAADLGWEVVGLTACVVIATIAFGMLIGRFFGFGPRFSFLSSGAVAICGASAALAISAVLPKDERSEERLVFTVVGVTVLSTFAMIFYPIMTELVGLSSVMAGIFLGATIHDVAQVVGAGFSVSQEAGEISTVVKLIRVSMLAPVVFAAALVLRRSARAGDAAAGRPPLVPLFVIAFFLLVALNSFGLLPPWLVQISEGVSRWALLCAVAAVGVNTSLKDVVNVGGAAIALLVSQTVFIALITGVLLHTAIGGAV